MDLHAAGKLATCSAAWSGLVVNLLIAGCSPTATLPGQNAAGARDFNSRTLVAGDNAVRLHAGQSVHVFEVEVPAEQDIQIAGLPTSPVTLGVGFVQSPDGRTFSAYPGAETRSSDGRFRVTQQPAGRATGFRFLGTASAAGTWRFSILARPRLDTDTFAEMIGRLDCQKEWLVRAITLVIYMLADQPALSGPMADWLHWAAPDLVTLRDPLDIVVRVTAAEAGELIDPADVSDDASGGDGDDGGSDGDGGDDGNGSSDGDGGDGGGNGDGDDGGSDDGDDKPPPQTIMFHAIARTGDEVPEQDGATFTYFGNPIVDEDGRVAFYAAYSGGAGSGGLYVWDDGTLQRVYDTDPNWTGNVPGMGPDDYFGRLRVRWDSGSPHLAWGSGGRLLFAAHLNGLIQPNALFRWRASDDDVLLVSNAELLWTAIPDSTEDFLPEFYHPGLSDDGLAIFSNRYSYFRQNGSFAMFEHGIFVTDGETTQEISVGAVPGQPDGAVFSNIQVLLTSHNAAGDILFQADYQAGEGNRGVYVYQDGEVSRAVDNWPSHSFSGLPEGAQVGNPGEDYAALAIGPAGHIAIDTTLSTDGAAHDTVLLWDNVQWYELQSDTGQYASDLLTGVNADGQTVYLADGRPFLGDGQRTVDLSSSTPAKLIGVEFEWEAFGGALNNHGRALLRYKRQNEGTRGLAFWSGQRWFVVIDATQPFILETIDVIFSSQRRDPDALDRAGTVSDRPEVNRPGVSGTLSDNDEWVLRAASLGTDGRKNTSDDQQAIFHGRGE